MPYQIPLDTIHQLQISLRNEANIPSYEPTGSPLPILPPIEESISQLDPSPPYLRCKHCKGRLLRGIKSLFCVFCGKEQFGEIPPDPINFRSTTGYRWLLDSLQLDGSEVVELISESTHTNRGRNKPRDEMPLSDLLNLEIPWQAKKEKTEKTAPQAKSSLNLAGVDLDNFFTEGKGEVALHGSQEQSWSENTSLAIESIVFEGPGDVNLFENTQPSVTPINSEEHESVSDQSLWAAEFQSAGSGAMDKDSRSVDPFASSQADISLHMDMVFGSGNTNSGGTIPSRASAEDWFQDNPRSNSALPSEIRDPGNSSSVGTDDWFQDNQQQRGSKSWNHSKIINEENDSLDAWDDFTSSTAKKDRPVNSSQEEPLSTKLFSSTGDTQEFDFGAFQQPDLFSEASIKVQSEADPTLERTFSVDEKDRDKSEAMVREDTTNTRSAMTEVIMSQMHDLSFMLDSNLSIPERPNGSKE